VNKKIIKLEVTIEYDADTIEDQNAINQIGDNLVEATYSVLDNCPEVVSPNGEKVHDYYAEYLIRG
jgi:hypothetical protein